MPTDPKELQKLVADDRFQALDPPEQMTAFRSFLHANAPEFGSFSESQQQELSAKLINEYSPGFLSKLGDVAEKLPVVGGAVRGSRAFEAGEPLRPMTQAAMIAMRGGPMATDLARLVQGENVVEPTGRAGQIGAEVLRDVSELGVAGGLTAAARPAIAALAGRVVGSAAETAAPGVVGRVLGGRAATTLVDEALGATTSQVGQQVAGTAARTALRERVMTRGLEALTFGELTGIVAASERGLAGGEPAPLEDFVVTPLGGAIIELGFVGLGGIVKRWGAKKAGEVFASLAAQDPEKLMALQANAGRVVEAIRKTGGLDREQAAEIAANATHIGGLGPEEARLVKKALRDNPDVLDTDLGLHIVRMQRERLVEPDIRVTDIPGLRVKYDGADGHTVRADITDHPKAIKDFNKLRESGTIHLEEVSGDNDSLIRTGFIEATPVKSAYAPGGGAPQIVRESSSFGRAAPNYPVPAVRARDLDLDTTLRAATAENLQFAPFGVPIEPRTATPTIRSLTPGVEARVARSVEQGAASPEAINRLRAERAETHVAIDARKPTGERVLPATVDRVNTQPGPHDIFIRRTPDGRAEVVAAGAKVRPAQLERVRAAQEVKAQKEFAAFETKAQKEFETAKAEAQRTEREGQPRLLAGPEGTVAILPDGDFQILRDPPFRTDYPEGAVLPTVGGERVRVVQASDPVGRIVVETANGRRVRTRVNEQTGFVESPDNLLETLPAAAPSRAGALFTKGPRMIDPRVRANIQPGQRIQQTPLDIGRRGRAVSDLEVMRIEGDRVTVRSGDQIIETTVDDLIESTITPGHGRLAYDFEKTGTHVADGIGDRVHRAQREGFGADAPAAQRTEARMANDLKTSDALRDHDRRANQMDSAAVDAQPALTNDNLTAKLKAQRDRPAAEKTTGGNVFVKGCKP